MNKQPIKYFSIIAMLIVAAGCGDDRPRIWDTQKNVMGPYKVGTQALWLDSSRGQVLSVDTSAASAQAVLSTMRRNVTYVQADPTNTELYVLTGGKEDLHDGEVREEPGLTVISAPSGAKPDLSRFYPMRDNYFDRLALASSTKLAIAYFSGTSTSNGFFRNPNEVAIINLDAAASETNPEVLTVRSFGSAPTGISFSPPLHLPNADSPARTLAVVLAKGYLTFIDLTNRGRKEITVPLTTPGSSTVITPQQVIFSAATNTVFVRADGSSDIYAISLTPRATTEATENDFAVTINQPSCGRTVKDMLLFTSGQTEMLLVTTAVAQVALLDPATSQFTVLSFPEQPGIMMGVPASQPTQAVISGTNVSANTIYLVDLTKLVLGGELPLTSRSLDGPVTQMLPSPDNKQMLLVHDAKRTTISLFDLAGTHHEVTPIQGTLTLGSYDFVSSTTGNYLVGVTSGNALLGMLNLSNMHPANLRLDYPAARVLAMGEKILVDHGQAQGLVTLVSSAQATRDQCQVLYGFMLTDLFNQQPQD